MFEVGAKHFIYTFVETQSDSEKLVYQTNEIKVKYEYKSDKVVRIHILLKCKYPTLNRDKMLCIIQSKTDKIKVDYTDSLLRIFKTKGDKLNYIVSIQGK